jgi:hypothetical protein
MITEKLEKSSTPLRLDKKNGEDIKDHLPC